MKLYRISLTEPYAWVIRGDNAPTPKWQTIVPEEDFHEAFAAAAKLAKPPYQINVEAIGDIDNKYFKE